MNFTQLRPAIKQAIIANDHKKLSELLAASHTLAELTGDGDALTLFLNTPDENKRSFLHTALLQQHNPKEILATLFQYKVEFETGDFSAFIFCAFDNPNQEHFKLLLSYLTDDILARCDAVVIAQFIQRLFLEKKSNILDAIFENKLLLELKPCVDYWVYFSVQQKKSTYLNALVPTYVPKNIHCFWMTFDVHLSVILNSPEVELFINHGFFDDPRVAIHTPGLGNEFYMFFKISNT